MSDFVRIRTESGYEASVSAAYAEAVGAEVLDAPATNLRGGPLPATRKNGRRAKSRTTVQEAADKKAAKKAASPASEDAGSSVAGTTPEEAS